MRQVPYRDRTSQLIAFLQSQPAAFLQVCAKTTEPALRKSFLRQLERQGGWGPAVPERKLKPGQSARLAIALRNRLIAMGFLPRTNEGVYDDKMQKPVERFQAAHGLTADEVAGKSTLAEINRPISRRLQSILVAMEQRTLGEPATTAQTATSLANLPDFTAKVIEWQVRFETRSVVGASPNSRT